MPLSGVVTLVVKAVEAQRIRLAFSLDLKAVGH